MAHVGHGALIGRGTYRAWHIQGVVHIGRGTYTAGRCHSRMSLVWEYLGKYKTDFVHFWSESTKTTRSSRGKPNVCIPFNLVQFAKITCFLKVEKFLLLWPNPCSIIIMTFYLPSFWILKVYFSLIFSLLIDFMINIGVHVTMLSWSADICLKRNSDTTCKNECLAH